MRDHGREYLLSVVAELRSAIVVFVPESEERRKLLSIADLLSSALRDSEAVSALSKSGE